MPNRSDLEAASRSNPDLRRVLERVLAWQEKMERVLGVTPDEVVLLASPDLFAPPAQVSFTVTGGEGVFQLRIINPAEVLVPMLVHEIQSSDSVTFEAAATTVRYVTSQLLTTVVDPDKLYYWRIRSRYPMGQWNGWQVTPEAVASGASGYNKVVAYAVNHDVTQALDLHAIILCSETITMTLPSDAAVGQAYYFFNSGTGVITLAGTIDGNPAGYALVNQYQYVELTSLGSEVWIVTSNN